MGVEVVQHHTDQRCLGERLIDQGFHPGREVLGGAPCRDLAMAPAGQRLEEQEHMTAPFAPILIVIAYRPPWRQRQRLARLADQLVGRFIDADHRLEGIIGLGIPLQEVFQAPNKVGIERGQTPLLPLPGLQLVVLSVRRPVSSEIASTTRSSTSWLASNCMVQQVRPSGGGLQTRAITKASCVPSSLR
jgi:hypothetical protein